MEKIKENKPKSRTRKPRESDGPTVTDPRKVDRFEEPFSEQKELNFLKRQFYLSNINTRVEAAGEGDEPSRKPKIILPDQSELELATAEIYEQLIALKERADPYSELQIKYLLTRYNRTSLFALALSLAEAQIVDKTKRETNAWFTSDPKKNLLNQSSRGEAFNSLGVKYPAGMTPTPAKV